MSATFNVPLFANYSSKTSVAEVENIKSYDGTEERYKQEEITRKLKQE